MYHQGWVNLRGNIWNFPPQRIGNSEGVGFYMRFSGNFPALVERCGSSLDPAPFRFGMVKMRIAGPARFFWILIWGTVYYKEFRRRSGGKAYVEENTGQNFHCYPYRPFGVDCTEHFFDIYGISEQFPS
ncbi:MAG: hypothetical protein LBI94_07980 [Treponema sp.]|nr:hypothetical protein [Treponema sp.]